MGTRAAPVGAGGTKPLLGWSGLSNPAPAAGGPTGKQIEQAVNKAVKAAMAKAAPKKEAKPKQQRQTQPTGKAWVCHLCEQSNPGTRHVCSGCDTTREHPYARKVRLAREGPKVPPGGPAVHTQKGSPPQPAP